VSSGSGRKHVIAIKRPKATDSGEKRKKNGGRHCPRSRESSYTAIPHKKVNGSSHRKEAGTKGAQPTEEELPHPDTHYGGQEKTLRKKLSQRGESRQRNRGFSDK